MSCLVRTWAASPRAHARRQRTHLSRAFTAPRRASLAAASSAVFCAIKPFSDGIVPSADCGVGAALPPALPLPPPPPLPLPPALKPPKPPSMRPDTGVAGAAAAKAAASARAGSMATRTHERWRDEGRRRNGTRALAALLVVAPSVFPACLRCYALQSHIPGCVRLSGARQQLHDAAEGTPPAVPGALGCSVTSTRSARPAPPPPPSVSMPGSAAAILRNNACEKQQDRVSGAQLTRRKHGTWKCVHSSRLDVEACFRGRLDEQHARLAPARVPLLRGHLPAQAKQKKRTHEMTSDAALNANGMQTAKTESEAWRCGARLRSTRSVLLPTSTTTTSAPRSARTSSTQRAVFTNEARSALTHVQKDTHTLSCGHTRRAAEARARAWTHL